MVALLYCTVQLQHFNVSKTDLLAAAKKAQEQAPAVFDSGFANDEVLCTMLAVSEKTKKNYLLMLVDMFLRESVYNHWVHKDREAGVPVFETPEWVKKNDHIKALKNCWYSHISVFYLLFNDLHWRNTEL